MKTLAPSYYPRFSCIAGKCRHSCCIGWEIGIDDESYQRFSSIDGGSGKILNKIKRSHGEFVFKTDKNGRCPFLNNEGLCDLIIEYGESVLCPICQDHPRFRSFYENFTEIGLGLSCEEAAKIVLTDKSPFSLIPLSDDGKTDSPTSDEEEMLSIRLEMISLLEDEFRPIEKRIRALFDLAECDMDALDFDEISGFLLSLERLDASRDLLINSVRGIPPACLPNEIQRTLKNLCVYFIYRHMPRALSDGDLFGAMLLSSFLCFLAWQIFARAYAKNDSLSLSSMISIARILSGELEYSDENLDRITDEMLDIFE